MPAMMLPSGEAKNPLIMPIELNIPNKYFQQRTADIIKYGLVGR